jgi:hypothetical protein
MEAIVGNSDSFVVLTQNMAKRIAALSADVDAFAAALVCRRTCKTCGGSGRVTGSTITYETDTEEERHDAWLMGSRRCPDCGQKPEAILAAHDAAKDKRIAEMEQNESALRSILNKTAAGAAEALTAICCKDERIAELTLTRDRLTFSISELNYRESESARRIAEWEQQRTYIRAQLEKAYTLLNDGSMKSPLWSAFNVICDCISALDAARKVQS